MSEFERFHQRLEAKANDVSERSVIYVAFGDSVTQGCMEYGVVDQMAAYPEVFRKMVVRRYPNANFCAINSGVAGDSAHRSRERWDRDLLSFQPDIMTLAFGINDCHRGESGLAEYLQAMEQLIVTIRSETKADLLLLTCTNLLMECDNPNVHPEDRVYVPGFIQTAENGYLRIYANELRNLAQRLKVPTADVFSIWEDMQASGEDIHLRLSNGLNHPDRLMHTGIAGLMETIVFKCF